MSQGHTLLIQVLANRPVTVTGMLDQRPLGFVAKPDGAWAVVGVPASAATGAHPVQLSIADGLGDGVTTTVSVTVSAVDFGSEQIYVPADRVGLLEPGLVQVPEPV